MGKHIIQGRSSGAGMLHRIEGNEEEIRTPDAAIVRAKTLRARHHAFTHGNFEQLLANER